MQFMRLLRFGIGIWAVYEAFNTQQWLLLLPAGILLLQAAFNVGCMGAACAPPAQTARQNVTPADVEHEEIR